MTDTDSIIRAISIDAPLSRVWAAIADHKEYGRWFRAEIDTPFIPGAEITGSVFDDKGGRWPLRMKVVAVEPETLLAFEWPAFTEEDGDLAQYPWLRAEYHLAPDGDGTRVTITESGYDAIPERYRDTAKSGNEGGWEHQARNLKAHVEG